MGIPETTRSPESSVVTPEEVAYEEIIAMFSEDSLSAKALASAVIQEKPFTELWWRDFNKSSKEKPELHSLVRIERIQLKIGSIAVCGPADAPTGQREKCAVLASLGLSNGEIGAALYLSEDTIKTHLRRAFATYDITNRANIALTFFNNGLYQVINDGPGLELSDTEWLIVDLITKGMENVEIGTALDLSPLTVKSHIARIAKKNSIRGREEIALRALIGNQIDYNL